MSERELEPEIGGFFRSNLLAVRKAIYQQDFKKFAALESNGERVAFILNYPEAHQLSLDVKRPMVKDSSGAIQLKETGNKLFGCGEFAKALETYSNAALLAPSTGKYTYNVYYNICILFNPIIYSKNNLIKLNKNYLI